MFLGAAFFFTSLPFDLPVGYGPPETVLILRESLPKNAINLGII